MKILVIGNGGREHALIWKLSQSSRVKKIYAAPGNGGTGALAENIPIKADNIPELLAFAQKEKIDLTVVGPEVPLTMGIVDEFEKEKLPIFGPNRTGAILEASKAWTKQFLKEEKIPTAHFEVFEEYAPAIDFLSTQAYPIVIKADGLAAGKGVIIAKDRAEAVSALESVLKDKVFGDAGRKVVIEEFLVGREASFQVLVDGHSFLPLDSAQDHKRVGEGDTGPNTGGMGVFSPSPYVTESIRQQTIDTIILPTLKGLLKRGIHFKGVLYAGLMMTQDGPKLLEYNCRFGDPETQALMVRLEDDLVDVLEATISGRLSELSLHWKPGASVCVVMAAHGYPGDVTTGDVIEGLDRVSLPETVVFHAGTKNVDGKTVTSGGRVLGVTAAGKDMRQARERAYDVCEKVHWKGVHYRRDIGGLK
ncbi:MAG: phosphoribosylamine--glycine ligase [Deltaproteobacteria bacterium]|nr:MAG: phosphoribosylamine--glycine ligase [Deltaproteobacteria bacterium]